MIQIPINHDLEIRDLLARWQVIRKAVPFHWDDEIGGSWHRPPPLPQYVPLIDALVQAGMDPHSIWKPDHDGTIHQLRHFASGWTLEDAAAETAALFEGLHAGAEAAAPCALDTAFRCQQRQYGPHGDVSFTGWIRGM